MDWIEPILNVIRVISVSATVAVIFIFFKHSSIEKGKLK
jgi:hypothetical protein